MMALNKCNNRPLEHTYRLFKKSIEQTKRKTVKTEGKLPHLKIRSEKPETCLNTILSLHFEKHFEKITPFNYPVFDSHNSRVTKISTPI